MEGESAHQGQEGGGNLDEELAPGAPGMNVVPHAHHENEHPAGNQNNVFWNRQSKATKDQHCQHKQMAGEK